MNASQTAVYEEFARSIPGFQPPAAGEAISTPPLPKPVQYEHGILGNAEVRLESNGVICEWSGEIFPLCLCYNSEQTFENYTRKQEEYLLMLTG